MKELGSSEDYEKQVAQNPKGINGHQGIKIQLGRSNIQLLQNINLELVEGDNKMKDWEESRVHIHEIGFT